MIDSCARCQERKPDVYTAELAFNNKTMEYLCVSCYTQRKPEERRNKTYEI